MTEQNPGTVQKYFWPYLTEIQPASKTQNKGSRQLVQKIIVRAAFLRGLIQFVLALLLSRVMFPEGIFAVAAPFLIVRRQNEKRWEQWLMLAGVFLGSLTVMPLPNVAWLCGALLALNLARGCCHQLKGKIWGTIALFGIWTSLRFLMQIFRDLTPSALYQTTIEVVISGFLAIVFQFGLMMLSTPSKRTKGSFIGLMILIVASLSGITGLQLFAVELSDVLLVFLLITISYLGGGGAGSIMGILISVIVGLISGDLMAKFAIFAITGLVSGLGKDFGKWGTLFGACLGFYFVTRQTHMALAWNPQTFTFGLGMAGFALTPQRFLTQISDYIPEQFEKKNSVERQQKLKDVISTRLSGIAKIFDEMVGDLGEAPEQKENQKLDLYALLDQVCAKNCRHCNGYEQCWEKHFYSTYRELFDLLACAELYGEIGTQHLKGKLGHSCYQQYKLITTVNHLFEKFQTELFWRRKYETGRNLIMHQMKGLSGFITDLSTEVLVDPLFKEGFEASIKYSMNKLGIATGELSVGAFRETGLEIKIEQKCCKRSRECHNLVAPMLSNLLGEPYMIWNKQCYLKGDRCIYQLIPEFKFEVSTTVCKLPKSGNEQSGDNHAMHQLKDGHFVTILSDGMGHGCKAAEESRITVNVLERLLENGIDRDFAIKMVNSMMALRSPEESFATVDLAMVDLYNAKAEFIKIGAAATYIKRGRDVSPIKSTSLPVGILNTVDVEKTSIQLQSGDLVIMVTDGVIDSKPDKANKEDWMIRALSKVEVVGPEALGDYLLNLARINQDGQLRDDMTVIVLQINKQLDGE